VAAFDVMVGARFAAAGVTLITKVC
jgi:hypothetical protein